MLTSTISSNTINSIGQSIVIGDMRMRALLLSEAERLFIFAYIDSVLEHRTVSSVTTKTVTH